MSEVLTPEFEDFWIAWPKGHKKAPKYARKMWDKLINQEKIDILIDLKTRFQRDRLWNGNNLPLHSKKGRRYIPNPSTYINQGRWMDETIPPDTTAEGGEYRTIEERINDTSWR